MLNLPGIVLSWLSIVVNILYLYWIFNAAYNIMCILTTSLSNRPRSIETLRGKKFCKIKQKLSCFKTAEEEVGNKACKPLLKPIHLPEMFHLCRYLCILLFLCQNPSASSKWLTTLFKYNLSLLCAPNFALSAMQTPWGHEL